MKELIFNIQRFTWATIVSASGTTTIADDVTIANGSDSDETITAASISGDTVGRVINGNGGADLIRNSISGATINGGDGNDYIYNSGDNVTIIGGDGNDSIWNVGENVTISGGAGNDSILNDNRSSVGNIYEYNDGDGNDVIVGLTSNDSLMINGTRTEITRENDGDIIIGVGSNFITIVDYTLINHTSDTSITGTAYADNIDNSALNVTISVGAGNDTIWNSGSNATISGGTGDDYIYNYYGDNATISGGAGDDSIGNSGNNVTISGGAGDDSIWNSGDNVTISAGDGNDSIYTYGDNVTISGGAGNDSIYSWGSNVTISGGAGDDSIDNDDGDNVTISGGAGDDSISLSSSTYSSLRVIEYNDGDGNDYISGLKDSDTLIISGTTFSTTTSGNDVIITAGDGAITLSNAATLSALNIVGGQDTDTVVTDGWATITNSNGSTVVADSVNTASGTSLADTIQTTAINATTRAVYGNGGDDQISIAGTGYLTYQSTITVDGGTGDDQINFISSQDENEEYSMAIDETNALINGGDGNDTVSIVAENGQGIGGYNVRSDVTINGGEGYNLIEVFGQYEGIKNSIVYIKTATGNDTVSIHGNTWQGIGNSTVTIDSGAGNDHIKVTSAYWGIGGGTGNDTHYDISNVTMNGGDGDDTIDIQGTAFGISESRVSINGGTGNDEINISANGGIYYSTVTASGGAGNDTINISADEFDGSMYSRYVIDAGNDADLINISGQTGIGGGSTVTVGGGAGDDTVNISAEYDGIGGSKVSLDVGNGNDVIDINAANGNAIDNSAVTMNGGAGNDTININAGQFGTAAATLSIDGGTGNDLISINGDSIGIGYGISYSYDSDTQTSSTLKGDSSSVTINGGTGSDTIVVNSVDEDSVLEIIAGAGDNISVGTGGANYTFDSTDAVTINGAIFTASTANTSAIIQTSINDITLASDWSGTVEIVDSNALTDVDGTVITDTGVYEIVDGNISTGGDTDTSLTAWATITPADGEESIVYSNDTVANGTDNADMINAYTEEDTIGRVINGNGGNDEIYNYSLLNATISGGTGDDTIYNENTLNGNVYQYNSGDGNDVIEGFNESDTLIIDGTTYSTVSSDNDLIITAGDGAITLSNAATLEVLNIEGTLASGDTGVTISNSVSDTVITGTAYADSIYNNASSVTIDALGDNDSISNYGRYNSISSGDGDDYIDNRGNSVTIVTGDGNDTVENIYVGGGDTVSINLGDGNDLLNNDYGWYLTIDAGDGDDTIISARNLNNSIYGGAGNDLISLGSNSSGNDSGDTTIKAGDGDDTIYGNNSSSYAMVYQYDSGDDNDLIIGMKSNDTLLINTSNFTTTTSGDDVIVTAGDGAITLQGAATLSAINITDNIATGVTISNSTYNTLITGTDYADSILNSASSVTIDALGGNDYIYNSYGSNVTIDGGDGEDTISNSSSNVKIDGGADNDSISNSASNVSISGGAGNDSITNYASNVTINGGAGNDTIYNNSTLAGNVYQYDSGDGNDVIVGMTTSDTLIIGSGTGTYSTSKNGNNVIVRSGDGAITLQGAANLNLLHINEDVIGSEYTDRQGNPITNPVATIVYDGVTYYYESVARASEDAEENSTVTVIANSTETSAINTTKGLSIQFNESGLGVYNALSGNFISANIYNANFNINSSRALSNNDSNYLQVASGRTATLDGYEVQGTSSGYTFTLKDTAFTFNDLSYSGAGKATFDTSGNVTLTAGAVVSNVSDNQTFTFNGSGTYQINDKTIISAYGSAIEVTNTSNGLTIGENTFSINGDNIYSINVDGNGNISSVSAIDANTTIISSGGASTITTDEQGTFNFHNSQGFTVSGDSSVDFILSGSTVTGVNNFENGTYNVYNAEQMTVNADNLYLQFSDTATFLIADSKVVSVNGIDSLINNLSEGATVHAMGAMTVNSADVNVQGDNDYNVIVASNSKTDLVNISAGASVSVANMNVTTDNNGDFTFGYVYTIDDTVDGSVTFTTDNNRAVNNVDNFAGVMKSSAQNVTVNGSAFTTSNTDVSIVSAGTGISSINGLTSGDSISGALDTAVILIPATTDTDTNRSIVTVNSTGYTLNNDDDGVILTSNRIDGLNSNASLQIGVAGTYLVNNATLTTNVGDTIIGTAEGSAYIYDPNNVPLNTNTMTDEEIAAQVGIGENYSTVETDTDKANAWISESGTALDGNIALALSNSDSTVAQLADFASSRGRKKVTLLGGAQDVIFNSSGGNVALIRGVANGTKNITLGGGGDLVIIEDTSTPINITATSGNDTIVTAGDNVLIDLMEGATKIIANSGSVTLNNYNIDTGACIQADEIENIQMAIAGGLINFNNNQAQIGDSLFFFNNADNTDNEKPTELNIANRRGEITRLGCTNSNGGVIDNSGKSESMLMIGNNNGDKGESTLNGGNGNDTIFAGAGDIVNPGGGNNLISLRSNRSNADTGATIKLTFSLGTTEIENYNFGYGMNADKIDFDGGFNNLRCFFDNAKNFVIECFDELQRNTRMTLKNIFGSYDLADSADLIADDNFINDVTLDDIAPITYEQDEYMTYATARETLSSGVNVTFAGA